LKPFASSDYASLGLSTAQLNRLQTVFPNGVCDWSKPGVGQQDAVSPLSFASQPGGQAIPAAPTAQVQ
jgi:hypothetical protein